MLWILDGFQVNAQVGQYAETGDGKSRAYDFSAGTSKDNWSIFANVSYREGDVVWARDRLLSSDAKYGTENLYGSTGTPQGLFFLPTLGAVLTTDPNANVTGPGGLGQDAFRSFNFGLGGDLHNYKSQMAMLMPQEWLNIHSQSTYQFGNDIRATLEVTYNEGQTDSVWAPLPIDFDLAGDPGLIAIDNIYNPFGTDLEGAFIRRRIMELGPRVFEYNVNSYRVSLGLEGGFVAADRYFDWELNATYGEVDSGFVAHGYFDWDQLRRSLSGQPCRDDSWGDGCVELNVFGGMGPDGAGTITREMLDYLESDQQAGFGNTMENLTASFTGELLELPQGTLSFAVGYEYRREAGFNEVEPLSPQGEGGSSERDFTANEFFVELAAPLLRDVRGAERLDLSVSARYSDYDTLDATTTAKVGIEWQPVDDLLLRATWSEGFRAPSLMQLFQGASIQIILLRDPCNGIDTNGDGLPDTNPGLPGCVGVPGDHYFEGELHPTEIGNESLLPETSESLTFGVVYSPSWLQGLDLSVDWYRIEINDAMTVYSPQTIADLCATTGDLLCSVVERDPISGEIIDILTSPSNIGSSEVEGVDLLVAYKFTEIEIGQFRIMWDAAYQASHFDKVADPQSGGFQTITQLGLNLGDEVYPRWKSRLALDWSRGDWAAGWRVEYIHGSDELCGVAASFGLCNLDINGDGDPSDGRKIGATTYHDVQAGYKIRNLDARLTLGVRNLFDKGPPLSTLAFDSYNKAQYRVPGRYPYVRFSVAF